MLSKQTMKEFAKYILRSRRAKKKRRGNVVEILIGNKTVAKYRIRNRQKIYIEAYGDAEYESLREVIRFDMTKHDKPVMMDKVQCTGDKCFERLIDEFPKEYNAFMQYCDDNTSDVLRMLSLVAQDPQTTTTTRTKPRRTRLKAGSGNLPEEDDPFGDIPTTDDEQEELSDALQLVFDNPNALDTIRRITQLMRNFEQRLKDVTRRG